MAEDNDYKMTLRIPLSLKKKCLSLAEENSQTLAGWIRQAMKEKYMRDSSDIVLNDPDIVGEYCKNSSLRLTELLNGKNRSEEVFRDCRGGKEEKDDENGSYLMMSDSVFNDLDDCFDDNFHSYLDERIEKIIDERVEKIIKRVLREKGL